MKAPDANEIMRTHGAGALRDGIDAGWSTNGSATPAEAHGGKAGSPAKGYIFTTFKDALLASASKSWILKGLIARGETSAWVGAPGSLKSGILTSLACAAASGRDWCDKRNKGVCAVIYLALERADLVRRRLRAYAEQSGQTDLPIAVVAQTINFMDDKVVDEIVATIDAFEQRCGIKVGVVILDTLAKTIAAGGGDEDKAKDHGKVYANIQRIKDRRPVHFAIACHPGKDESKGVRGSSAARGDFDIEIIISGRDTRVATISSNNDGPTGHLAAFKPRIYSFAPDDDGDPVDVCLAEEVIGGVPAPTKDKKTWARSLTVLRTTLNKGLDAMGCDQCPYPDGPVVRAVDVKWVRAEFSKEYHVDPDKTPDQQKDARKKAFKRAVDDAQARSLIAVREIEGVQYVWLA